MTVGLALEGAARDVGGAVRTLAKSPGFTAATVLMLAFGIGANVAIFSVVDAVLWRALPYRDPAALVRVAFNDPGVGLRDVPFSVPELDDLRLRAGVFEDVSVVFPASVNVTGAARPERLELLGVSPNYFSLLGATPEIGRLFDDRDRADGFAQAVVISDAMWRRSFGADPSVLGRAIRLDNDVYTIAGVLPRGFRHPGPTVAGDVDVWATAGFRADPFAAPARGVRQLPGAIARLQPGVTLEQARARLAGMAAELAREFPGDYPAQAKWSIEIQPLRDALVHNVRPMLLVLLAAVVAIILLVSANLANLLLARASARRREWAVRVALGAGRGRLVSQLLAEALVLAIVAGGAGLVAGAVALDVALRFIPPAIPRLGEVRIDSSVLLFGLLVSLLTGGLFGLMPAIHVAKDDLFGVLRDGARGSGTSARTTRARGTLVVVEVALAVVLMVGAGLLLRTFAKLVAVDPGFMPSGIVTASVWLPVPNDPKADKYNGIAPQAAFVREVLRRARQIPGVELAGLASALPVTGQTSSAALVIEDRPETAVQDLRAEVIRVSPDYFAVIGCPLVRGRAFEERDDAGRPPVVMIDETTARRYWPDRDPVGRHLRLGQDPRLPWFTVAGVVKDIRHDGLETDGVPHVYVSVYQRPSRAMSLVARTRLPVSRLEPDLRRVIQAVDSDLPVFNVRSMNDVIDLSLAPRRFSAGIVAAFAAVALLLASIGVYGLLAYIVSQGTREIGVRLALGAKRRDIVRLVAGRSARLAGAGVAIGLLLSAAAAPALAALLYGVRPFDPPVFVAVPLVLLAVAGVATALPVRRALGVNPLATLRHE